MTKILLASHVKYFEILQTNENLISVASIVPLAFFVILLTVHEFLTIFFRDSCSFDR